MRIALLGDIHYYTLRLTTRQWLNRRILGQTNLLISRRKRFVHDVLPGLVDRLRTTSPDLVLCAGDLSTTSLEREFAKASALLDPLHRDVPVVVVPGNHDRYTYHSRRHRSMENVLGDIMPARFPHVRDLRERWRLLALDAAIPNVLSSRGRLGDEQLERFARDMAAIEPDQGVVILCHYPVSVPRGVAKFWTHDLKEERAVRHAIAACRGRVVYLHGHVHRPWRHDADRRGLRVTSINAGSPSFASDRYPLGQGFWTIDLPDDPADDLTAEHHAPFPHDADERRWIVTRPESV